MRKLIYSLIVICITITLTSCEKKHNPNLLQDQSFNVYNMYLEARLVASSDFNISLIDTEFAGYEHFEIVMYFDGDNSRLTLKDIKECPGNALGVQTMPFTYEYLGDDNYSITFESKVLYINHYNEDDSSIFVEKVVIAQFSKTYKLTFNNIVKENWNTTYNWSESLGLHNEDNGYTQFNLVK